MRPPERVRAGAPPRGGRGYPDEPMRRAVALVILTVVAALAAAASAGAQTPPAPAEPDPPRRDRLRRRRRQPHGRSRRRPSSRPSSPRWRAAASRSSRAGSGSRSGRPQLGYRLRPGKSALRALYAGAARAGRRRRDAAAGLGHAVGPLRAQAALALRARRRRRRSAGRRATRGCASPSRTSTSGPGARAGAQGAADRRGDPADPRRPARCRARSRARSSRRRRGSAPASSSGRTPRSSRSIALELPAAAVSATSGSRSATASRSACRRTRRRPACSRSSRKQVNPTWTAPNSPWAGEMAGQQVAGGAIDNPLKARWMGVAGSVGIHGTGQPWTIGSAGLARLHPHDRPGRDRPVRARRRSGRPSSSASPRAASRVEDATSRATSGVVWAAALDDEVSEHYLPRIVQGSGDSQRTSAMQRLPRWTLAITAIAIFMVSLDNLVVSTRWPASARISVPRSRRSSGPSTRTRSRSRSSCSPAPRSATASAAGGCSSSASASSRRRPPPPRSHRAPAR